MKKLTEKQIKTELIEVLKVALYDLASLNRHDPLYSPRCKRRAEKILLECGVTEYAIPFNPADLGMVETRMAGVKTQCSGNKDLRKRVR